MGSHTSVADAEVAVLVADLLAADRGHTRSLIPKLHKLYCSPSQAQQTPPMELLQHPKVGGHSLTMQALRGLQGDLGLMLNRNSSWV